MEHWCSYVYDIVANPRSMHGMSTEITGIWTTFRGWVHFIVVSVKLYPSVKLEEYESKLHKIFPLYSSTVSIFWPAIQFALEEVK